MKADSAAFGFWRVNFHPNGVDGNLSHPDMDRFERARSDGFQTSVPLLPEHPQMGG